MRNTDYDILMIALPRWDGPYASTSYSLAKEFSRNKRVFFIDNPFTIKDVLLGLFSLQFRRRFWALLTGQKIFFQPELSYPNLVVVTPLVILPINWLPEGRVYRFFLQFNDIIVKRSISKTIKKFTIKEFIFFNSFNPFYGWKSVFPFGPTIFFYQSVDDISRSAYVAKHGTGLEREMIRKADATLVTSLELKRIKSLISDQVFLIPNAAAIEHFNRAAMEKLSKPCELIEVPEQKKIICYIGNICHRIDYSLLKDIATYHKDMILLLVGPFTGDQFKTSGLSKFSNVIVTGPKPLKDLPAYLQYSHCCIIPFVKNDLTRSIYPLKINEYLAAGKPVVTTKFSEDIDSFKDVVAVCDTSLEFVQKVGDLITNDSLELIRERIVRSADNNWEARARMFLDLMEMKFYEKGQSTDN